jgi:tetratricopeptide (TPR) repeat protein
MQFKNSNRDIRQIRRQLNAAMVIDGSLRRVENRFRIVASAFDTSSGQQVWSRTYERLAEDLARAEAEVGRDIAKSLFTHSVGLDEAVLACASRPTRRPTNITCRAWRAMIAAREKAWSAASRTSVLPRPPIRNMRRLIRVWRTPIYVALSIYGYWRPQQAAPEARRNAERAVELDPSMGDPHADLGFVAATYDWNPSEAQRQFRQSIELNPSCAHCRAWYALYALAPAGEYEEARRQVIQAEADDPLNPAWPSFAIGVAVYSGHFTEGLEEGRRIATPENRDFRAHTMYATGLTKTGRIDEAVREARRAVEYSSNHPLALRVLGAALAAAGNRQEALAVIDSLQQDGANRTAMSALPGLQ